MLRLRVSLEITAGRRPHRIINVVIRIIFTVALLSYLPLSSTVLLQKDRCIITVKLYSFAAERQVYIFLGVHGHVQVNSH